MLAPAQDSPRPEVARRAQQTIDALLKANVLNRFEEHELLSEPGLSGGNMVLTDAVLEYNPFELDAFLPDYLAETQFAPLARAVVDYEHTRVLGTLEEAVSELQINYELVDHLSTATDVCGARFQPCYPGATRWASRAAFLLDEQAEKLSEHVSSHLAACMEGAEDMLPWQRTYLLSYISSLRKTSDPLLTLREDVAEKHESLTQIRVLETKPPYLIERAEEHVPVLTAMGAGLRQIDAKGMGCLALLGAASAFYFEIFGCFLFGAVGGVVLHPVVEVSSAVRRNANTKEQNNEYADSLHSALGTAGDLRGAASVIQDRVLARLEREPDTYVPKGELVRSVFQGIDVEEPIRPQRFVHDAAHVLASQHVIEHSPQGYRLRSCEPL